MVSVSTTKSGSNWLDRLRTSRGFPTGDEPDLDRFISSSSTSGSSRSESSTRPQSIRRKNAVEFAVEMSDVLSDLFNMGECSRSFSKPKNGRKQSNPKPFSARTHTSNNDNDNDNNTINNNKELCSSDDLRRERSENGALVSSGDNSLNDNKMNDDRVGVAADDGDDVDLKAYSKSEVTVIDTSFAEWKSEKWVFRKDDEWKIKDKYKPIGRKKRKFDDMELKNKVVDDVVKENEKEKEKEKETRVLYLNKEKYSNDREREPSKEPPDFVWKVPPNRFPCPRPPEKSKLVGSPVVILKSIPPSSSNGVIRQGRKSSMKKPPKRMKIV